MWPSLRLPEGMGYAKQLSLAETDDWKELNADVKLQLTRAKAMHITKQDIGLKFYVDI